MPHSRSEIEQFLFDQILKRQNGDSNVAFARKLGIPRETWQQTRNGLPLGKKVLRAVSTLYPELKLIAAACLLEADGMPFPSDENAAASGNTIAENENSLAEVR